MSIKPRGGSWQISVTHDRKRIRTQIKGSEDEAVALEAEITLALLRHGAWPAPGIKSLDIKHQPKDTIREGLKLVSAGPWSASINGTNTLSTCQMLGDFLGLDKVMDDVTTADVQRLIAYLRNERHNSPATIRNHLSVLTNFYKQCISSTPPLATAVPEFEKPKGRKRRNRAITREEEAVALRYYASREMWDMHDAVVFGIDLGLRLGEIGALTVRSFRGLRQPDAGAHVHPSDTIRPRRSGDHEGRLKTETSYDPVPMSIRTREIANRRCAARHWTSTARIFPGMTHDRIRAQWDKMREHLDLLDDPGFTFHCTRHACATRLVEMNCPLPYIKKFMRHAFLATTEQYVVYDARQLNGLVDAIDTGRYISATFSPVSRNVPDVADFPVTSDTRT